VLQKGLIDQERIRQFDELGEKLNKKGDHITICQLSRPTV